MEPRSGALLFGTARWSNTRHARFAQKKCSTPAWRKGFTGVDSCSRRAALAVHFTASRGWHGGC